MNRSLYALLILTSQASSKEAEDDEHGIQRPSRPTKKPKVNAQLRKFARKTTRETPLDLMSFHPREHTHHKYVSFLSVLKSLLEFSVAAAIISSFFPRSDNMSSPPPSYYGTTTVSEKPSTKSEKPAGSRTYHLTLERRKWTIMLACGLAGCMGLIEHTDAAITIPDNADWDEIRKEVFRLYKKAWPAILGKAKLEDYAITVHMDYTAQDGCPYRQVSMLEYDGDALWELRKRDDINIIKFCASCSPLEGEAPGKVRSSEYVRKHLRVYEQKPRMKTKPKDESKSKHHCILQ